jgi:glycerol-3-phosphate O-acyltransferase
MLTEDETRAALAEVAGRIVARAKARARHQRQPLAEVINQTLVHERERLRKPNYSEDPEADKRFYARIARELPVASDTVQAKLFEEIVQRYLAEIRGHFSPFFYGLSTRITPVVLGAMLTSLEPRSLIRAGRRLARPEGSIVIEGDVARLRRLRELGTVVVTPTHSSNLDSLVIGLAMHMLGMPPLLYGAGLNLFRNRIIGRFLYNLGAYTVDRLKTDPLYRDVLKEWTAATLEFGQDNLFFPGGTRSRSGALEARLKRGLLGASLTAYRNNLRLRRPKPRVFVVPCTLSYPLVLEAQTLIEDHLKEAGRSRFIIIDDEFSRLERWVEFLRGLIALDAKIHVRIGEPLDPFGNDVDEQGRSLDPRGRVIDPAGYLMDHGKLVEDPARDAEYTDGLAVRIVESFARHNVALPTHVAAFAVFERLRRDSAEPDLFRFLRDVGPETSLAQAELVEELDGVLAALRRLHAAGRVQLEAALDRGPVAVLEAALRSFASYHTHPVLERKGLRIHVGDANLLFFYRNRLAGYPIFGDGRRANARPTAQVDA